MTSPSPAPGLLGQVLSVVYLCAGSFSFAQPQCLGLTEWIHIYGINVSGMILFLKTECAIPSSFPFLG